MSSPYPALIDTGPIFYTGPAGLTQRPCRTWESPEGEALSIVTEPPGAEGLSVTNAAETIADALRSARPGHRIRVIEHYPADTFDAERYAQQPCADHPGRWTPVKEAELEQRLGPALHLSSPFADRYLRWSGNNHDQAQRFIESGATGGPPPVFDRVSGQIELTDRTGSRSRVQLGDVLVLMSDGLYAWTPGQPFT